MLKKNTYLLFLTCLFACQPTDNRSNDLPVIVCTTGMIGDLVQNLAGDQVQLYTLMGPGVDPHLYKATQGDLEKLTRSDLVFYNGLHLEGKMAEVFEKLAKRKNVKAVADGVDPHDLLHAPNTPDVHDPHIWFDVNIWIQVTRYVQKELIETFPRLKNTVSENASRYIRQLETARDSMRRQLAQIPEERRVLITSHDAFHYFGRAFDIEVKGLQGISTVSDFGLKDINDMVSLVIGKKIKAIFVESSVSQKAIQAVVKGCQAKGTKVNLGGPLFSDAMGAKGTPEGTYIGMLQYNAHKITEGLR